METADFSKVNFTFFLDTHFGEDQDHFIKRQDRFPVLEIDAGCEAKAFLQMVDFVANQPFSEDTLIYFLEDDYLHRENWVAIFQEGFSLPGVDYLTLFDDRDKYFLQQYQELISRLFHTKNCHWRTTPSTTNTYGMRMKTLKKDLAIHREFSLNREISADYEKFCELGKRGSTLISPIPGWSTHVQPENASPCFDWEETMQKKSAKQGAFKKTPLLKKILSIQ